MEQETQDFLQRKVELAYLAAFYSGLLTDKQKEVLSMYCEEDMSLGEIARETGVSRQGVYNVLTRSAEKLFQNASASCSAACSPAGACSGSNSTIRP